MKMNQILGDNPQLRFENIGYLKGKTKKWGIILDIPNILLMIIASIAAMNSGVGVIRSALMVLVGLAGAIVAYFIGKGLGWGWYWFKLKGGRFGESVGKCLDDAMVGSFFIGSTSIWVTLITLGVFVAIGGYIGLYCLIRYEWIEYRKLKKALA